MSHMIHTKQQYATIFPFNLYTVHSQTQSQLWAPEVFGKEFRNKSRRSRLTFNIFHFYVASLYRFYIKFIKNLSLTTLKLKILQPQSLLGTYLAKLREKLQFIFEIESQEISRDMMNETSL
ncbi:CLUMA_CG006774, isoform A [Clunio marinus]|uniref:CLUMA_CG006774, isoform A n=1 Tax=Clunio marinus TaxID=568069 RepID=A0A1J1I2Z7_9DIPT|nr:CLUMA_CG006774, isoform A [Clunio marinus]